MTGAYGQRVLVLSPHPDDEIVGASALMGRAIDGGSTIFVVHLTTGVPSRQTLWPWERSRHPVRVAKRQAEARAVAAAAGFSIIGFGDESTRHVRSCLAQMRSWIAQLVSEYEIDTLWAPAYEGGHSDHDAANALASTFTDTCRVFEIAEYNFQDQTVHSQKFISPREDDTVIDLSDKEIADKHRFLRMYESEQGNLGYVDSAREAIRPLKPYAYEKPPHAGRLFYQRFQWVPFRHPRIDWTTPNDVSADIVAFLDARRSRPDDQFP